MKTYQTRFVKNIRAMFYALSITCGIYISLQELYQTESYQNFMSFTAALLLIFLIEIFISWRQSKNSDFLHFEFNKLRHELPHLISKVILPVSLYISLIAFGYYHMQSKFLTFVLLLTFFSFYILFLNIKAYFENEIYIDDNTIYIYDIIKFLVFFNFINYFANSYVNVSIAARLLILIAIAILSIAIIKLMLWKAKRITLGTFAYTISATIVIETLFFLLLELLDFNPQETTIVIITTFYLLVALIHHKIHQTLNKNVVTEYFLVIVILISILYGIR